MKVNSAEHPLTDRLTQQRAFKRITQRFEQRLLSATTQRPLLGCMHPSRCSPPENVSCIKPLRQWQRRCANKRCDAPVAVCARTRAFPDGETSGKRRSRLRRRTHTTNECTIRTTMNRSRRRGESLAERSEMSEAPIRARPSPGFFVRVIRYFLSFFSCVRMDDLLIVSRRFA